MFWWYHGVGMWWMALWFLLWIFVIAGALWIAARFSWAHGGPDVNSPETILKRRYASGDIDREEYERRLSDIRK